MKNFYYLRPIANGMACLMLVSCGVAAIIAPCITPSEGLAMMESLNDKLVFACEALKGKLGF